MHGSSQLAEDEVGTIKNYDSLNVEQYCWLFNVDISIKKTTQAFDIGSSQVLYLLFIDYLLYMCTECWENK